MRKGNSLPTRGLDPQVLKQTSNKTGQDRIKFQLDHLGSTQRNEHLETKSRVISQPSGAQISYLYPERSLS